MLQELAPKERGGDTKTMSNLASESMVSAKFCLLARGAGVPYLFSNSNFQRCFILYLAAMILPIIFLVIILYGQFYEYHVKNLCVQLMLF